MQPSVVDMREALSNAQPEASPSQRAPRDPAQRMAFAISVVEALTAGPDAQLGALTLVRCPRRPSRRTCGGFIMASQDLAAAQREPRILWNCVDCGARGAIVGFQGTPWDHTGAVSQADAERQLRTLCLDTYRWARLLSAGSLECELLLKGARVSQPHGAVEVSVSGPTAWFEALRERVEIELVHARGPTMFTALTQLLSRLGPGPRPSFGELFDTSPLSLFAELDIHGWQLDDGEARHIAHPDSFWIPDLELRTGVVAGSIVKLIFAIANGEDELGFERMWVVVEHAHGTLFMGRLDNAPLTAGRLGPGHPVFFGPEHIIDIWTDESEPD